MSAVLFVTDMLNNNIAQAVPRASTAPPLDVLPTRGAQVVFEVVESDFQPDTPPGSRFTCTSLDIIRALTLRVRIAGNGDDSRKAYEASARLMPTFAKTIRMGSLWGTYTMMRLTNQWSAPVATLGDDGITATGWIVELPFEVHYFA